MNRKKKLAWERDRNPNRIYALSNSVEFGTTSVVY